MGSCIGIFVFEPLYTSNTSEKMNTCTSIQMLSMNTQVTYRLRVRSDHALSKSLGDHLGRHQ